jgi:cupin fold WbuC family metalloprotein
MRVSRTLRQLNPEVFVANEGIVRLGVEEIAILKESAHRSTRGRARICAHTTNEDQLHEMVIAIAASSYVHPHRHPGKSESFHIIEGAVDVVILREDGAILDVVQLGTLDSCRGVFYRLADNLFHTLLIRSDVLVVHEVTNGPFRQGATELASFAPQEHFADEVARYMTSLNLRVDDWIRRNASMQN